MQEISLVQRRLLLSKSILVFSPHPDDETLGCGGTIAKKLAEGYEVTIVVLTDGRNVFLKLFGINSDPGPNEVKEIRKEEVRRAVGILGVSSERLLFLDFEDGTLEKNEKAVKEEVRRVIEKTVPQEIYYTSERDFHKDHQTTCSVVHSCLEDLKCDAAEYRYTIRQTHSYLGPAKDCILNLIRHNIIRIDISEYLALKQAAIEEFKSQLGIFCPKQPRPLIGNVSRFLSKTEAFFVSN